MQNEQMPTQVDAQLEVGTHYTSEEYRTSENNMMCFVEYVALTAEEQNELEKILKVV